MFCPKCTEKLQRYKTADKKGKKAYRCKNCGNLFYYEQLFKKKFF